MRYPSPDTPPDAGTPERPAPVEGDNTAGLAHRVKHAWAMAGINLHGAILTVIGGKFVGYVTFDSVADANRAATIMADVGYAKVPAKTR